MHLIIIQLQRQSPLGFGRFPSVKNPSPIHIFHRKTAHPHLHQCIQCFKFQSNFAVTLHPIMFGKSTFTHSSSGFPAEVAVSAESRLQIESKLQKLLEFENKCSSAKIGVHLQFYRQIAAIVFYDKHFLEKPLRRPGWQLCKAHVCEVCLKTKETFVDGQNGIWQVLKDYFTIEHQHCRSYWNLEVYARMPRLESTYVFIGKLQPLHFTTYSFWRGLHYEGLGGNFAKHMFVKCAPNFFWWPKWHFDRYCRLLHYWTSTNIACEEHSLSLHGFEGAAAFSMQPPFLGVCCDNQSRQHIRQLGRIDARRVMQELDAVPNPPLRVGAGHRTSAVFSSNA